MAAGASPSLTALSPFSLSNAESSELAIEKLKEEAVEAQVGDLDVALGLADMDAERESASLSDLGRLVKAMIKLESLNGIISHTQGFTLLMPGNVAVNAARQATPPAKADLVKQIATLRMALVNQNILPADCVTGLPKDSPEYMTGLAEVRTLFVGTLRATVENHALKHKLISRSLDQAESAKNALPRKKSLNYVDQHIRRLLEELSSWEAFGTNRPRQWEATEAVISNVKKGEFPWANERDGDVADEAQQRLFGERYRTAKAQVDRAKEEVGYLKMEVVRLVNGVEERIQAVDKAVEVDLQAAAAAEAEGEARKARVLKGRSELRLMDRARLEMIKEEADKLRGTGNLFRGR